MKQLIDSLNQLFPLTDSAISFLSNHIDRIECKKGDKLLQPGDICRHLWFIEKGLLRSFEKGPIKESNNWFMMENDFVTSVSSFFKGIVSTETVEALEDTVYYAITKEDLFDALGRYPDLLMASFQLLTKYYCQAREMEAILRKAKKGALDDYYAYLLNNDPRFISRVPVKHLTSFMGITAPTLSRIRERLKN